MTLATGLYPRRGQHYAAHGIVTETNSAKLVNRADRAISDG